MAIDVATSAARAVLDPVRSFNFLVALVDSSQTGVLAALRNIASIALGGFSECSGLEGTLQVYDHPEGGGNDTTLHFPTRMSWSNIRLRRGVTLSDELWNWHYDFVQGRGRRRDGIIVLENELRMPIKVWQFSRGIPTKWTGPALDAAQSRVAIEELEITHEGLLVASLGTAIGF